jgi:hypothetical protein
MTVLIIGDGSIELDALFSRILNEWNDVYLTAPLRSDFYIPSDSFIGFSRVILSPGNIYPKLSNDLQSS